MMGVKRAAVTALVIGGCSLGSARAADMVATMRMATPSGPGEPIGTVTVIPASNGTSFKADLKGLPPGPHGFHLHENGSCAPSTNNGQVVPAGAAGGHYDPAKTGQHEGPFKDGHLGDLPVLTVAPDGTAKETVLAPRIKDATVTKGRALMIHVGGDNYSDKPAPLGGGGARLACGVVE